MKAGQTLKRWWQTYVLGGVKTPQGLIAAVRADENSALPPNRFFGAPPDGPAFQASSRLSVPASYFTSKAYLDQGDRADWQQTDFRLMRWAARFVELARKRGIPLYVHCAFRTEKEQAKVNASGNSNAAFPNSAHNIGEAVDVVHSRFHWDMSRDEWLLLQHLGFRALDLVNADLKKDEKLHLTWGGNFQSLYDPAHWEITDFRSRRRRLKAGLPIRRTPRNILRHY